MDHDQLQRAHSRTAPPAATGAGIARTGATVDLLVLALGALALVTWVFGGRRIWGEAGETWAGWWAWAAWCGSAALVRRLAGGGWPSPGRVLARWFLPLVTSPAFRAALPPFLATRLPLLLAGYLALVAIGFPPGTQEWRVSPDPLWNMPARWDTGWYLGIASRGYEWQGRTDRQQNIVFFPAFPMAMRAAGALLGGRYLLGGLLVSLCAFFAALMYLYRLARCDLDHDASVMAVTLVATYPFGVFFGAVYTESLYLLCVTGAVYHFRRAEWVRAGIWAFVIGMTRPNGVTVAIPLALMWIGPIVAGNHPRLLAWLAGPQLVKRRNSMALLLAAGAPAAGLLCYVTFNYWMTGDPLAWMHAVRAWGRSVPGAAPPPGGAMGWSPAQALFDLLPGSPKEAFNMSAGLFMAALVVPVTWRFGAPYGLFIVLVLLPPILSGGSESLGRYTAVLFPAFLWLGAAIPARRRTAWVLCFALLQAVGAALFFTWRPFY